MKRSEQINLTTQIETIKAFAKKHSDFSSFYNNVEGISLSSIQDLSFEKDIALFNELSFILSVVLSIIAKPHLNTKSDEVIDSINNTKTDIITDIEFIADGEKKDIEDLKKQIKIYESLGCARNKDVNVCRQEILARQQAQGLASALNASGWRYPLAKGCVTSEYTGFGLRSDWSGGGGHHAIDLDCVSEGTPIYAAASGIVERVTNFATCGGNTVYIYHTINGKKYTTLYMHLLRFASGLKANQIVTENTIIGYVGGYSTASGHGGTDRCTTGTHLHFGIAEGWHAYDFNYYSINPREKYAFPKLVYNGGGYFYR